MLYSIMQRARAKVFWSGRSQAVRLPKEFRFATHEVLVSRRGDAILLEAPDSRVDANGWPLDFWKVFGAAPNLDLGDRDQPVERRDPLGAPSKKRTRRRAT